MSRNWIRIHATLLTLVISSVSLGQVSLAQTEVVFTVDSISRACDANRVDITWTTNTGIKDVVVYLSNTSDSWSSVVPVSSPVESQLSVEYDHHAIDKVTVEVSLLSGAEFHYEGQVGTCGVSMVTGGQTVNPTDPPGPTDSAETFTISGTVTDTNGTPITGAEVCAEAQLGSDGSTAFALCTLTSTSGGYSLPPQIVQPLRFVSISVSALDYSGGTETVFEPTGDDIVQNFTLQRSGGVKGMVRDEAGNAINGVMVCIQGYKEDFCNFTDANGAFDLVPSFLARAILIRDSVWQGGVYGEPGNSLDMSQVFEIIATRIENPEDPSLDVIRVVDRNGNPINHFQVSFSNPYQMTSFRSQGDSNELWIDVPFWETPGGAIVADISIRAANCPTLSTFMRDGIVPDHFAMDCEVGIVAPTETSTPVTPSPEVTETPTPEATLITIQVNTADGSSLEGAPFGVYAPAASTLPSGAIFTGTVGANNILTLPADTLPGNYVIRIAPADADLIEFSVSIGADTETLVVDLTTDPGATETPGGTETPTTPDTTPTASAPATEKPAATDEAKVDSLPTTGSGASQSGTLLLIAAATIMLGGIALGVRANDGRRRT